MSAEEDPKVTAARAAYEEAKVSAEAAFVACRRAAEDRNIAGELLDDALGLPRCEMYEYGVWLSVVIVKRDGDGVWVRYYGHPDTDALRFILRDGEWVRDSDDDARHGCRLRGVP